jgi:hypothetical protein
MSNESPKRLRGVPVLPAPQPIRSYLIANFCAAATAALILLIWLVAPHLEAQAAGPAQHGGLVAIRQVAPGVMTEWEPARDGDPRTYRSMGVLLTLSTHTAPDRQNPGQSETRPAIHIVGPGGEQVDALGENGLEIASSRFGVGRVDPRAPAPQVVFSSYTGGAHCCQTSELFELIGGRWRQYHLGSFDHDITDPFPTDIDHDGIADLVGVDERFNYAYDSYADSNPPPRIWNVIGGRLIDVSTAPRYRRLYEQAYAETLPLCRRRSNGACASMVASGARLGRADAAWRFMLTHYQPHQDWTYPAPCRVPETADGCPEAQQTHFANLPQSLSWLLHNAGYTPGRLGPLH